MSAPDIVAHEYTHAVINSIKPLGSYGIPGALNESFADIFGELVEYYSYDNNADWVYGGQVMTNTIGNKDGIRSLSNPKDFAMVWQSPNTFKGEYWIHQDNQCDNFDNCGIHINNGVHNYWFYLLANGGYGINYNNNSYNLNGIGINIAASVIIKNLADNLNSSSTYNDAMLGSIEAAANLFGKNSNELNEVIEAWRAVGIDYYKQNPITWQVVNSKIDGTVTVTNEGTIEPYTFDLTIDSLGADMTADKLFFTLHPSGTHRDLVLKKVYPPLNVTEIDTFFQNGTLQISINRSNLNTSKTEMLSRTIKSGSPILGFGLCLVSEDFDGECTEDEPIEISEKYQNQMD